MTHQRPTMQTTDSNTDAKTESKIEVIPTQVISMLQRDSNSTLEVPGLSEGDSKTLFHAICLNDTKSVVEMIDRMEINIKTMPCFVFGHVICDFITQLNDYEYEYKYNRYSLRTIIEAILFEGDAEMFSACVHAFRSKMPLSEVYSVQFTSSIINKLIPHHSLPFSDTYLSDSRKLISVLKQTGFFSESEDYHYNQIVARLRQILSNQYFEFSPIRDTRTVFFEILDSVPEFKDFYKDVPFSQIPNDLEFIKTACKYSLNIHTNKITRTRTDLSSLPYRRYDVLPSPDILAFLYSKGRNPERDVIRLRVDYRFLVHSFAFKQFTDFRTYQRLARAYPTMINIEKTTKKFKLRYDEDTIQSINTMLDFWRMTENRSIDEQKKYLSRTIMQEKYSLEYPCFSKQEAELVHDSLEGVLPSFVVDMILVS